MAEGALLRLVRSMTRAFALPDTNLAKKADTPGWSPARCRPIPKVRR